MSATVLLQGRLHRDPTKKTSTNGNEFAMATVRSGQGDDALWFRVFAFSTEARDELITLRDGDAVAISGPFKAEVYAGSGEPRVSLTVTADRLISAKRQKREKAADARADRKTECRDSGGGRPFDDSVPF